MASENCLILGGSLNIFDGLVFIFNNYIQYLWSLLLFAHNIHISFKAVNFIAGAIFCDANADIA